MATIDREDSYGDIIVRGLELDDGTYLKNYKTELRHENGTEFLYETSAYEDYDCRVFGWGPYDIVATLSPKTIQAMYDDGVLEVLD